MKDLDDLAAFAVLHDLGSFTRAAERLGCSKGQLSKRIVVLEQKLGVTLLHRTTRRLSLTAAGVALLPEAQALLVQAERECLLNSHYSGHEEWLYHRHHRLERVRVAGFLASNHYSLLKKAALAGTGIARLPSYMVHDELGDGRLAWLLRDYQTRSTPMFLVHPFQGGLPLRTQVLADYLLDWFERSRRQLIGLEG
ncbi:LysR family transcriptional regulator [Pseudomonas aeruginosa]|uniref:LysR family transcriptional regulator n=1 Tax=Pseudomonas aeruginosa TaxID=287 RepID=UPI004053DF62